MGRGTHCRFRDARHESAWKLKVFDALRDGILLCLCLGRHGSVGVVLSWHVNGGGAAERSINLEVRSAVGSSV
jgi:hypothetical protein